MNFTDKIIDKFNLSPAKKKVVTNLIWAVAGKITTLLGSLLVGILVARYLGPQQYGLMNYVFSYVMLFQVFATFGLDNIEIREEAKNPENKDKIIGTAFCLKIAFAILTIGAIILISELSEADALTRWMIYIYSLSIVMNTFSVIRNHFTALVWNEYIVKTEILRTIIGAGVKIVLLLIHAPLWGFICATLFDTILLAGGYITSYRKKIGQISLWKFDKPTAFYLIKQSFPLLLSGAAIIIYQKIDQVMLGNMIDKQSVGFYSVAGKFTELCIFVPTILSQTITPILVKLYENNVTEYKNKAQSFMNLTIWGTVVGCLIICLIASPLIRYTFGPQYISSIALLQIMVFKVIGYAFAQTTGAMIVIEKKQQLVVIRNIIGCITSIGLNLLLIPLWGVKGAVITSVITAFCTGFLSHIFIPRYHTILRMQIVCVLIGWKDLLSIPLKRIKILSSK
jgi:O-antigen/teichoic acid export membrane protein